MVHDRELRKEHVIFNRQVCVQSLWLIESEFLTLLIMLHSDFRQCLCILFQKITLILYKLWTQELEHFKQTNIVTISSFVIGLRG